MAESPSCYIPENRSKGFRAKGPGKTAFPFPIDSVHHPYNNVGVGTIPCLTVSSAT